MRHFLKIFLYLLIPLSSFTQPIASFTTNIEDGNYCVSDTVFFTNTSSGTDLISFWQFGDGSETWLYEPFHIFLQNGNFTVSLKVTDNLGNSNTVTKTLIINQSPVFSLIKNSILQSLTASSNQTDLTYIWYFNNILTSESDSIIFYFESGLYSVEVSNELNCSVRADLKISLASSDSSSTDTLQIVVLNNILTPELQDGANDILFIDQVSYYNSPCKVLIYNKWGQLVYKNDNYTNLGGFEGKDNNGKSLDAGTYYYQISSEGRKNASGFIDLIK